MDGREMSVSTATARLALRSPMTGAGRTAKRAMDVAFACSLLLLCSPLIAALALATKLFGGGPVFHRRRVVGLWGEFDAFKLRSMRVDADEILARDPVLRQEYERNFKLKDDPRVTPFGRFLRRTSLDELPQLWNVLKGEMSLVGPRMITPAELERYGEAAWIFKCVKPGLTGDWQINGRQQVSYEERVAMDLHYVQNWSLANDLAILLKTPLRAVRGTGAY